MIELSTRSRIVLYYNGAIRALTELRNRLPAEMGLLRLAYAQIMES